MQKIKYFILASLLLPLAIFTSCDKSSVDIMVVGVKHSTFKETDVLINTLTNKSVHTIDHLNFYTGNIGKRRVAIAETTFGTSEAAMATTIGIKQYSPKYVINAGSAGGHHSNIHLYDVVLGKDILDIASYQGDPYHPESWTLQNPNLHSDEKLLETASKVENKFGEYQHVIKNGTITSSDAWNTGKEFVTELQKKFKEDCEEMESYAVANVCSNYKIPFLAIKMISNNLIIPEAFDQKVCAAVQQYTIDVIKTL